MDNLDVLQVPTSSLLSSSGNNTSSGCSTLPKTINRIVRRKLYNRTTRQTSPSSSSPRRSSSSRSSPPFKNWRHKWRLQYRRDGATSSLGDFSDRRRYQRRSSSTTGSVTSPRVGTANRSLSTNSLPPGQSSIFTGESPRTPQSKNHPIVIESDDDDDETNPFTPSPIRNSPSYGREHRQRRASSSAATLTLTVSYPVLPLETSTEFERRNSETSAELERRSSETSTKFERYHPDTLDDSTIDTDLIQKLRKGPKAEKNNGKLAQLYTAQMEGEDGHVKIGWTEQGIQRRMKGLNSPSGHPKINYVPDRTPGGQSRFRNSFFAEQIIHLELRNFRRNLVSTSQSQGEWFEIDKEEAHRVCRKWRKWLIDYKPYGENHELTGFWERRLDHMDQNDPYDALEHGSLHERWTAILNPSWWDKTSYIILITCENCLQWLTWIRDNFQIIALLIGIILWASKGSVWFLLCIFIVSVGQAGVSTTPKQKHKRS